MTDFSVGITAGAQPYDITTGSDGNLWFTEEFGGIGRITPLGVVTEFTSGITAGPNLLGITTGPDGNLWFTESNTPAGPYVSRIGRITPLGVITEFSSGITAAAVLGAITMGPDGNLWFTEGDQIGRITPLGNVTEFSAGITEGAFPVGITTGPDGNLWFTEADGGRIGRITPLGVVTEFSSGITAGATPWGITLGPDGNLWFTETDLGLVGDLDKIGRITPLGVVTEFSSGITTLAVLGEIATGPDGNLWFTETSGDRVGRITPLGIVTEFSNGITAPNSITTGPDGNVWFTAGVAPIGRISGIPNTGSTDTLTVTVAGGGSVTSTDNLINCPGTCSAQYASGTGVTLNESPTSGSSFAGWSGACSGTGGCSVTMSANESVAASFTQQATTNTLTVAVAGGGSVQSTDSTINCPGSCSAQYSSGTGVTLNAFSNSGWSFAGWSGACSGTAGCSLTMNANESVAASFTQQTGPCASSATALCIDQNPGDGRFQIQITYSTSQGGGRSGSGNAIGLSGEGVTEGGLFWFFGATNPEMLIKILNGCGLNKQFWVFYAATTNVGFTVTVTDTLTGHQAVYTNPDRTAALPVQDTSALTCP